MRHASLTGALLAAFVPVGQEIAELMNIKGR